MKRKGNNANRQDFLHKRPALRRILHASGIHHGDFTALSNVKGSATEKLSQLHEVRDRRVMEPHDSPNRMENVRKSVKMNALH